jgi:FHA domain-containing protein
MAASDPNELTFDLATVETRLRIEAGGREWVLDRERPGFRFGRDADNDLVVQDRFASRHHGSIAYREGRFHLTDGSRNGTVVVNAGAAQLAHGGTVLLVGSGSVRLGHDDGVAFVFATEIRSGAGRPWQASEARTHSSANVFRLDGDFWTVGFEGRILRLKDARGLRYLAHLIGSPGREVHVLDLALVGSEGPGDVESASVAGGAGPLLDAQARAEYRRRLAELRDQLEESERQNDTGRAERVRDEMESIAHALAEALGLGGRDREAASNTERARVAVTRRIRDAVAKIARGDAGLGEHLSASIHTGRFCSYRPGSVRPVTWEL